MWMIDPTVMCRKHLLGEHVESHMLVGSMKKGRSFQGFVDKGLIEPAWLINRHEQLAEEMGRRGYNHKSDMDEDEVRALVLELPAPIRSARVDRDKSLRDLCSRCPDCLARVMAQTVAV